MAGSLDGSQSDDSPRSESGGEDVYEAFLCPLTKKVMDDPVTLENGRTFEREAIEKWFDECREKGHPPSCPVTLQELNTMDITPSIALRNIIQEWRSRNEAVKLDMARQSLYLGNEEADILQALKHVQEIGGNCRSYKHGMRDSQLTRMIIDMLRSNSHRVRYKALQTLQVVVEGDDESKAIVAEGDTVRTIVKFLSYEPSKGKEAAVCLLFELSKSEALCEKIGSTRGAILLLVGMASSQSENITTVEKADRTLENLARSKENVMQMAINGRSQPLLAKLVEGSPETKLSMASLLGELALNNEVKVLVAQTAGSSLINLMKSQELPRREAALRALNKISSFEGSAKILIETGILPPLIKDLFLVGPNSLPIHLKEVSATILANIVNTCYDFDKVPFGSDHPKTLVSEDMVKNLLYLVSYTGPAIQWKLLEVLVGLTSSPTTVLNVVSTIRTSGAIISLVQFIEVRENTDLRLASLKLLHNLSPHMSEELANALRGTIGQLGNLVSIISENTSITEEQAEAAGLLAGLPERDLGLTQQMLGEGAFEKIIHKVVGIRQGEITGVRFEKTFLEGLVRILARVTFVFAEEPRVISFSRENNLASIFVYLLQSSGQDTIQMVSAMALENLSSESTRLTRIPEIPAPSFCASILSCVSKPPIVLGMCCIHRGICSLRESFCLVEGQAVDKLVALLEHKNEKVVEAALAALCTLLEDGLEIEKGVRVLEEANGIWPILNVLLENGTGGLRRKSVWAVERILRVEEIAREVAEGQNVSAALVDAFQNADYTTKQIAENALRHIDRIPNFSGIFSNSG